MEANEMTFGVEIECTVPAAVIPTEGWSIGGYHRGRQVPMMPNGWQAQADCSIRSARGMRSVEIVSPVLRGEEGLLNVLRVCKRLNTIGAKVNDSTGLHIHVGFSGTPDDLNRIVSLVANFETAIYAATGTKRRQTGLYCQSIRSSHRDLDCRNLRTHRAGSQRYHVLNISNLASTRLRTVEFRAFSGSTNGKKIIAYVRLCLGLVQRGFNTSRRTNWTAKTPVATSPIHRNGEGQTAMTRLFYQLGWTKGRVNKVHGGIIGEGLPTIKDSKKELIRLAKKYDTPR